ncbi:MAG TPA: polysaccharide biosynthesis/export family protein [Hyphomicrobiaceae bacterium]|nr:polysaccharide biosynthesis/export family protein [Hyphomicrobiaceae bacterium]
MPVSTITRRHAARSVWVACLVALVAAFSVPSLGRGALADVGYTMGSGDKIKVTVFGQANMSGEFSVAGDGTVSLPFIGTIRAGGLTVRQLEQEIVSRLQPDYLKNPRVNIEILNFRPFDIIGEVQKPGSYPYRDGMTVINAIAIAGGFTYRAKEKEFRIKRANGGVEKAVRNTVVKPGDVIEVLERFF